MADIGRDDDADLVDLGASRTAGAPAADPDVVELREEDEDGLPAQAVQHADGRVELPLRAPVTLRFKRGESVRPETFESLVFHPLTGADMRVIQAAGQDSIMPVAIARSTRIHEGKMNAVYDRLDARDATAAQRCVLHFLGNGRPTGR